MEWITDNLASVLIFVGIALLAIEILVLGLSVFILLFIGLASMATGLFMIIGLVPANAVGALTSIAVLTFVSAVGLWKPLKKMQNNVDNKPVKGDFIGLTFVLAGDISVSAPGSHRYSGIDWKIKSAEPLPAGTKVEVIKTAVGELTVAAASGA